MCLLSDRVGLNSMNLVGLTCDLVQKLLTVSMQEQV